MQMGFTAGQGVSWVMPSRAWVREARCGVGSYPKGPGYKARCGLLTNCLLIAVATFRVDFFPGGELPMVTYFVLAQWHKLNTLLN